MKTAALPEQLSARADKVRITVAKNLSNLLEENRWSRRAAATALGLTHTYVNSRASGDVDLSSSDLVMFADFLHVTVADFFAEAPEVTEPDAGVTRLDPARTASKRRSQD